VTAAIGSGIAAAQLSPSDVGLQLGMGWEWPVRAADRSIDLARVAVSVAANVGECGAKIYQDRY
jgi:hypothetical protein